MSIRLTQAADVAIAAFKFDFPELVKDPSLMNDANHPMSVKVMNSLHVLAAWSRVHHVILERAESSNYFYYNHFVRSNAYSNVLVSLLGLSPNAEEPQSIFSMLGI